MKIEFSIQGKINVFSIQNEITASDLDVISKGLVRFFDSNPPHVVLDLSQATLQIPEEVLQHTLSELKTHAMAKNLSFVIAQTDIESIHAPNLVVELALQKKLNILENKVQLREEIREKAGFLLKENQELRDLIKNSESEPKGFSPFIERLWSNR